MEANPQMGADQSRLQSEIAKIIAETVRINQEGGKILAETSRINAETNRIARETKWYPAIVIATAMGGTAALITAAAAVLNKLFS